MRRRQLDHPEAVSGGDVGIQTPAEALVEALGPIDIETATVTTSRFSCTVAGAKSWVSVVSPVLVIR